MIMSGPSNHLGSIWYHSEPSDVPYYPNQFLAWTFFPASYSNIALDHNTVWFFTPKVALRSYYYFAQRKF